MSKIKILKQETLAFDHYLLFKNAIFLDTNGKEHHWSYVERNNSTKAVVVVPVTPNHNEIILIRQFRIPLNGYVIEFPAGLMEQDEEIQSCSLRELEEETGYQGKIIQISPVLSSSAGLTSELIYLVLVEISGSAKPQNLESSEEIEVLRISLKDARPALLKHSQQGDFIDSKVWAFLGMNGF